jgi:hypothetical protein
MNFLSKYFFFDIYYLFRYDLAVWNMLFNHFDIPNDSFETLSWIIISDFRFLYFYWSILDCILETWSSDHKLNPNLNLGTIQILQMNSRTKIFLFCFCIVLTWFYLEQYWYHSRNVMFENNKYHILNMY